MAITLKAARVNKHLSQKDAAKLIGVNVNTLSKWENGKHFPSTKYITRITKAYSVEYDDLIFLPGDTL